MINSWLFIESSHSKDIISDYQALSSIRIQFREHALKLEFSNHPLQDP